jgi:type IV secretory pathway TrbD component
MAEQLPAQFTSPVYQSLTTPILTAGVPRGFFILNGMVTFGCVAYLHWLWYLPIGFVAYAAVKMATKYDPYWWGVLGRALRYKDFYEA